MKFIRIFILSSLLSLIISPLFLLSQTIINEDYNSFSFGIKGGIQYFYGDVRQFKYDVDNKYKKSNTCFGIETTKNFNHIYGVRLGVLTGGLSGSSPNLNLHFESKLQQLSLQGTVNLNNLLSIYPKKEKKLNAYVFAGIGAINFRSKIFSYDENLFITSFGWDSVGLSKSSAKKEMVYPFGIGVKFKADNTFDFGIEFSMQLSNTDKLDVWMVEKSYMDRYSNLTACLTYKIGNKKEFVEWVNPKLKENNNRSAE